MAAIATVLSVAVSAIGSVVSGMAASNQAAYQAQIADMNRKIAEENAKRSIERSQVEQQDRDAQSAAFLGAQEAAQAASGLSLGGRSFMLTRKSARELARRDALNVRQAGELEAYAHRTQAANFGAQAELARMEASNSMLAGFIGAASSIVGGASKIAGSSPFSSGGGFVGTPVPRPKPLLY